MSLQYVEVAKENGVRVMYLVSSNPYRDGDREIVREKALNEYVDTFHHNELRFWHRGRIGSIVHAEMVDDFLHEKAVEGDNRLILTRSLDGDGVMAVTVKQLWDYIEQNPDDIDWGCSIGFRHAREWRDSDGTYSRILKHETSVLPRQRAANSLTFSEVVRE